MFIRNIIFDMGGVIIPIDFRRTAEAFVRLGVPNFHEIYNQNRQAGFIDAFETGKITAAEFRQELRAQGQLASTVTDQQIDEAWNALFINLPREHLELIKSLKIQFKLNKLLLFSNTNEIHYAKFSSMCSQDHDLNSRGMVFTGCFDAEYYSFRLGKKKPNPEAFIEILNEQGLKAEETLFIDDSIQHVHGAREAGLHAIHLDTSKGKSIMDLPELITKLNRSLRMLGELSHFFEDKGEEKTTEYGTLLLNFAQDEPPRQVMTTEIRLNLPSTSSTAQKQETKDDSCCYSFFWKDNKGEEVDGEQQYLLNNSTNNPPRVLS